MTTTTKRKRRAPKVHALTNEPTGGDLLDVYIEELRHIRVLSAAEQKALARRMRDSSLSAAAREAAREELVRSNLRFAFSIAKQYQNRGVALADLVSEANAGLMRAVDKYDPDVGVNFISYAVWWIRQALFSSVVKSARSVHLPVSRVADLTRISRAQTVLRERMGREPTPAEVAHVAGLTEEVVRSLEGLLHTERSLDEPVSGPRGEREGRTLASMVHVDNEDIEDGLPGRLAEESRRDAIRAAMQHLSERERKVLTLYYGLDGGESKTLSEIAVMFGVSRERVRQLRDRALGRLRQGEAEEVLRRTLAA